ncbi:hypothetical protein L226DRAFT_572755 [Lentinus tigrinus ALCF2SS1-7]|uniref:uncharacterized protein n=1 Tax=Lentinus tigrinus ALCF2SS1-7 TaxID=1328758 RepID=UPI001165E054|nr:hypothetical protein L226DRAFT_572755 [Lentinus tigrinus ALCF2SS1-7]
MVKRKDLNTRGSENDVADSPLQGDEVEDESQPRRPNRAAKANASKAWSGLKPRSAKRQADEEDLEHSEDDISGPRSVKKAPAKRSKASTLPSRSQPPTPMAAMYSAPDIDLDTDEERSDSDGEPKKKKKGKKGREASTNKTPRKDMERDSPKSAPRASSKGSKPSNKSDSSASSDNESQQDGDVDEEESSGKSDLEELEKDGEALDRVFRDESPAWADELDRNTGQDAVAPSPYPAPSTSDDTDDDSARTKHSKPEPEKISKPKKRAKVLPSSDESEKSDGPAPPPPKKHKHVRHVENAQASHDARQPKSNADKGQRSTSATSDGKSRSLAPGSRSGGQSGSAKSKAVARETVRAEKGKAKGEHNMKGANSGSQSHVKRKRTKINENVEWADGSDADENADNHSPTKRSRTREAADEDSAMSSMNSNSDGDDSGIDIVPASKGHLKLTDQHHRVRRLVQAAIHEVLIIVCTQNAFPEGTGDSVNYARRALINAAKSVNDKDVLRRLKSDDKPYWQKLASMVTQRLSNLRGEIKKKTNSNPSSLYGLKKGDATHVAWLLEGLRYIYPNDYTHDKVDGSQPFAAPIFEEVLTSVFFRSPRSLGYRLVPYFTSSLPDKPDEKEIPAALLALVSTALYASIDDYRQLPFTSKNFTVNANLEAYQRNVQELANLKARKVTAYHRLMHGFYVQICGGRLAGVQRQGHTSFLNTDNMAD